MDPNHHIEPSSLVAKLHQQVENNLQNEQFGVEQLADSMGMSRSQLHRRLKKATGQSTNQFIREYRLQKAMELLKQGDSTVSDIAFEVGYGSHSYFTTCFTQHFGYPPGKVKDNLDEISTPAGSPPRKIKNYVTTNTILVTTFIVVSALILFWYKMDSDSNQDVIHDKSIAVLPFKNMSGDPEQEFICEGITEDIIHHLSMITSFDRVISFKSVMTFKDSDKTLPEIARQLQVDVVLTASLHRSGDQIKINAQLINATTDDHLWSEAYEGPFGDIFDIQSDITKKIATRFDTEISPEEAIRLDKKPTENSEAYILLQKAWYKFRDHSDWQVIIDLFKQAIAADSNLAEAYVGLATAYLSADISFVGDESIPVEDPLPLVKQALRLDPELGQAYQALANIRLWKEWNFPGAESAFKKALALDPENSGFNLGFAQFLIMMGRAGEAIPYSEKAVEMDPTSPMMLNQLSKIYFYAGKDEEARNVMVEFEFLFPNFLPGCTGHQYLYLDSLDKAINYLERVNQIPLYKSCLAIAYARTEQLEKAKLLVEQLKQMAQEKETQSVNYSIGLFYSETGQMEEALDWLDRSYNSHDTELYFLKSEPFFKPLHGHPRYEALLRKIGFPE